MKGFEKIVVINDNHIPFHDKVLFKLFKMWLKDFMPDRLIINGDLIDCWEISKYDRVPRTGETLNNELRLAYDYLKEIREIIPKAQIDYTSGNHEFRLRSYLIRRAPELYGLDGLRLEDMLKLSELGIIWHDVRPGANTFIDTYIKVGQLYVGHFAKVNQHAGYTAKNLVERKGVSIMQGHVHRYGVSAKRLVDGRQLVGIENFCMCDLNPNYASDVNWQQGWSVVYHKKSSGRFHVYPIHAVNYAFIWDGKLYDMGK